MSAERPTLFSQSLAAEICRRLSDGELLCEICGPTRMPSRDTVRHWQDENAGFRSRYAAAREQQADALAEEAIRIACNAEADTVTVCRLQIDTIKWLTAKIAPTRYGEKAVPEAPAAKASVGDAIEKGRERVVRLRKG